MDAFFSFFKFYLIELRQSSGSDESLAVTSHQQHIRPHGPLVLRLGPGPSATVGGPVGSQLDGEVVRCGFFPSSPPPPLPSCSSASTLLLLAAAPLPSQPISSRLVRGAVYSANMHPFVACTPFLPIASSLLALLSLSSARVAFFFRFLYDFCNHFC